MVEDFGDGVRIWCEAVQIWGVGFRVRVRKQCLRPGLLRGGRDVRVSGYNFQMTH